MEIRCLCGQEFTIHNERFPQKVSCHVCGNRFHIMDDGSLLNDNGPSLSEAEANAIQTDSAPILTAITGQAPIAAIEDAKTKLAAKLRFIDLLWESDRHAYSLISFFGVTILPSRFLSIAVALVIFAIEAVFFSLMISTDHKGWLCPELGCAALIFIPVYIYTRAHRLEKAESNWLRQRALAIGQSGLLPEAVAEMESKRPLLVNAEGVK